MKSSFFCSCLFNVEHGQITKSADISAKKLKRPENNIAIICKKDGGIMKKRRLVATRGHIILLKLIEFSVLNRLKKRLDIKQ